MNYRFTTSEIKELIATSGTETVEGVDTTLRKSLLVVFTDINSNALVRSPNFEQLMLSGEAWSRSGRSVVKGINLSIRSRHEQMVLSDCYRAIMMFERIRLLYSSLGTPLPTVKSGEDGVIVMRCLQQWAQLYREGKAEAIAKYQSVSLFNTITKTEPLETIELPFSWCLGCLSPYYMIHRNAVRKIVRSQGPEQFRLLQCFLYFKKGCPPASSSFIEATLKKHEAALTKVVEKPSTVSIVEDAWGNENYNNRVCSATVFTRSSIKRRIDDLTRDVFSHYTPYSDWWDPSGSASYEYSRNKGGQALEIEFFFSDDWDFFDTGYSIIKVPTWVKPKLTITKSIMAKPVALTEPLKVRVITCESAWITYALAGAQKALWNCLRLHPWFRLVGRPCEVSDIFTSENPWISVDYSAATDNLNCHMTRWVTESICRQTGLPFELCYDSLSNHMLDYTSKGGQVVAQRNGQLMGSILSFIVLCVANGAIISLALNPTRYDRNDDILINGDDGLFTGGDITYNRWKYLSNAVGLAPSIGKVYHSRDFCVINSTLYLRHGGIILEIPYPNASAMLHFDAKSYREPRGVLDYGDAARLWLSGFPTKRKQAAYDLWMDTFRPGLMDVKFQSGNARLDVQSLSINWFIPQSLGGLGLPLLEGMGYESVSRLGLARARYCLAIGPCWTRRSECSLSGLDNPFVEKATWLRLNTEHNPDERDQEIGTALGYVLPVTRKEDSDKTYGHEPFWVRETIKGVSAVGLACLNRVQPITVMEGLSSERELTSWAQYRELLKSKHCQDFWRNPFDMTVRDLQGFNVQRGSRKLNKYQPRIMAYDRLEGKHYHAWLRKLYSMRDSLRDGESVDLEL